MFNAIAGLFQSPPAVLFADRAVAVPFVAEGPNAWSLSLSNGPLPSAAAPAPPLHPHRLAVELLGEPASGSSSQGQLQSALKAIWNRPMSGFLQPLPAGEVGLGGVEELDEIPVVAMILALWNWATADPCKGFDAYANGGFKLSHPMTSPMASAIEQARVHVGERLIAQLQTIPDDATGTAGMLRTLYTSALQAIAQHASGQGWVAFAPQADAIAALATTADVIRHFCSGPVAGRESVLGLSLVFDEAVVSAQVAGEGLAPLLGRAADDTLMRSHLDGVIGLLVRAGMTAADAARKAPVVHAMTMHLVNATTVDHIQRVDLAAAGSSVPGFPFDVLWQQLGVDPATSLYITPATCAAVVELLATHAIEDWRAFLLYQEANRAAPCIEMSADPARILAQLDQPHAAGAALGQLYANGTDPARERHAQALFSQLRATFIEDVAASALSPADQKVLADALAWSQLQWEAAPVDWLPVALDQRGSYLGHLQALQQAMTAAGLRRLGQPATVGVQGRGAHEFALAFDLHSKVVALSPAMLDALWDGVDGADDARCGAIGSALGHELAHLVEDVALSNAGKALRQQQGRAILQRVDGRAIGPERVDGTRVLDEVAADLRGASAAHRVCEAAATAEGRRFDPAAFFQGAAAVHAANPSRRQLQASLQSTHPPGPVRADLLAEVRGFEAAFGCDPAPRNPFHRVI